MEGLYSAAIEKEAMLILGRPLGKWGSFGPPRVETISGF